MGEVLDTLDLVTGTVMTTQHTAFTRGNASHSALAKLDVTMGILRKNALCCQRIKSKTTACDSVAKNGKRSLAITTSSDVNVQVLSKIAFCDAVYRQANRDQRRSPFIGHSQEQSLTR
jgi:hypothetical protein